MIVNFSKCERHKPHKVRFFFGTYVSNRETLVKLDGEITQQNVSLRHKLHITPHFFHKKDVG